MAVPAGGPTLIAAPVVATSLEAIFHVSFGKRLLARNGDPVKALPPFEYAR